MDPSSGEAFAEDPVCKAFLANETATAAIKATKPIAECEPLDYAAVCVAGGHGPMWDLPGDEAFNGFVAKAYEGGKVVSGESSLGRFSGGCAACWGPSELTRLPATGVSSASTPAHWPDALLAFLSSRSCLPRYRWTLER